MKPSLHPPAERAIELFGEYLDSESPSEATWQKLLQDHSEWRQDFLQLRQGFDTLQATLKGVHAARPILPTCDDLPTEFDDFVVLGDWDVGGMASIILAAEPAMERLVVLKVTAPNQRDQHTAPAEAVATAHCSTIPAFRRGQVGPFPYLAMQLEWGMPLHKLLQSFGTDRPDTDRIAQIVHRYVEAQKQRATTLLDARLPGHAIRIHESAVRLGPSTKYLAWVADFTARLAEMLELTHRRGMIHRDVKPGNILVTDQLTPKLIDFGVAVPFRERDLAGEGEHNAGTMRYMAPELVTGATTAAQPNQDVYSLGATLFAMAYGEEPYAQTSDWGLLEKAHRSPPSSNSKSIPRALEMIIEDAVASDPEQRTADMGELHQRLAQFLRQQPTGSTRRRWIPAALVGAATLAYVVTATQKPQLAPPEIQILDATCTVLESEANIGFLCTTGATLDSVAELHAEVTDWAEQLTGQFSGLNGQRLEEIHTRLQRIPIELQSEGSYAENFANLMATHKKDPGRTAVALSRVRPDLTARLREQLPQQVARSATVPSIQLAGLLAAIEEQVSLNLRLIDLPSGNPITRAAIYVQEGPVLSGTGALGG